MLLRFSGSKANFDGDTTTASDTKSMGKGRSDKLCSTALMQCLRQPLLHSCANPMAVPSQCELADLASVCEQPARAWALAAPSDMLPSSCCRWHRQLDRHDMYTSTSEHKERFDSIRSDPSASRIDEICERQQSTRREQRSWLIAS